MKALRQSAEKIRSKSGFTLVEILIAVAISLILMAAIFEVFIAQKRRYVTEDLILEMESSGNIAIEYLSRLVQNSGYNITHGMKIESASDHYFTTVIDDNDNGVIEADEVITVALNTPIRDIGTDEQPTEIVYDPALNGKDGNNEDRFFDFYFDMDSDGVIHDTEVFESGYNLADAPLDNDPAQMDAIKLYLTGPPYALYQYDYVLKDESIAYDPVNNPYIVNTDPDVIVEDVDNFIIRYFDQEDEPLPVTYNTAGERIAPNPPYVLTREEMNSIRRVEFELVVRTTREDPEWTETGGYPVGSVATYDDTGRPDGFSCGDSGYPPTNCTDESLNSYDCFVLYCNEKVYPGYGELVPYEDNYRRVAFEANVYPKNLILNPYGTLTIEADPKKLQCPDTEVTLTATVRDAEGQPISGATVNFYSSANVSILDFTSVSDTDAEGNPMTDADGEVTGITLQPWAKPGLDKMPVNVTVSADTSVTVTIDGDDKEFPFYDSIVVPFLMGPPSTLTFTGSFIEATACDATDIKPLEIEAVDCNDFKVTDAVIELGFLEGGAPVPANHNPGDMYYDDGGTPVYDVDGVLEAKEDEVEDGKYTATYVPPVISNNPCGTTYPSALTIVATALEFDGMDMYYSEPAGWGISSTVSDTKDVALLRGRPYFMIIDPTSFSDSACRGNNAEFNVTCRDCGWKVTEVSALLDFDVRAVIDTPIYGKVTDMNENDLASPYNMPWNTGELFFNALYLITGCANSTAVETIDLGVYDAGGVLYPGVAAYDTSSISTSSEITIDLLQCPTGLHVNLKAREPGAVLGDGTGNITGGFLQDGCDYDILDIEAWVILNLPPTIECDDITFNPVEFTITGGQARFYDSGSGSYDLTTVTVTTNSEGKAIAPIKLLSTIDTVTIEASSDYGTDPTYSDTENITLDVGNEDILMAYRDYCYTERLTSANPIWTGDYVYLEVNDCLSNDSDTVIDYVDVEAFETSGDVEDLDSSSAGFDRRLEETEVDSGKFRGRVPTTGLVFGTTSTVNDGMMELTNAGYFDSVYVDDLGNPVHLFDSDYIQSIVDRCDVNVKFSEAFSEESNEGPFNFLPRTTTDSVPVTFDTWAGCGTIVVTETSSPEWPPAAMDPSDVPDLYRWQILQHCDELYLSGSVPFMYMYDDATGTLTMPPATTPDYVWENSEVFAFLDMEEDAIGEESSESLWGDYVVTFRYKYLADDDDAGYAGTNTVSVDDYYLPGIDDAVCFFFRGNGTMDELVAASNTPTVNMIEHGYLLVWTEDTSGDPLARLLRVEGADREVFPVTVDITQVGYDVTLADGFDKDFRSGDYVRIYAELDGGDLYFYIDDYLLDFDGSGGASAIDRAYSLGTVGVGVKGIIAKFDNIQVCGCSNMGVVPGDISTISDDMYNGTPVTLTLTNLITGLDVSGPLYWEVYPPVCGTFSTNPTIGSTVTYTNTSGYPDYFTVTAPDVCSVRYYPVQYVPQPYVIDFEEPEHEVIGDYWTGDTGDFSVVVDPLDATNKALYRANYGSWVYDSLGINDAAAEPFWKTTETKGIAFDNYIVEFDTWFTDDRDHENEGCQPIMLFRFQDISHHYRFGIRNSEDSGSCPEGLGAEIRFVKYNAGWTCLKGVELSPSPHAPYFLADTKYHLKARVEGYDYEVWVTDAGGSEIAHFTIYNDKWANGPPGLCAEGEQTGEGTYFDNFTITPIP